MELITGIVDYGPYISMSVVAIVALYLSLLLRKKRGVAVIIGTISWVATCFYFLIEYIAIRATTAPYSFLKQPMSDLGVTTCGTYTYPLASHAICSPYHELVNWANALTGIAIFVGAICFHRFWPSTRKTTVATVLLVVFGLSNTMAGVVPGDMNFILHTIVSLPSMLVQIPALFLIAISIHTTMPKLSAWTYVCAAFVTLSLLLIFIQPFTGLPGGLLQRILYASSYIWAAVTAIVLWNDTREEYDRRVVKT